MRPIYWGIVFFSIGLVGSVLTLQSPPNFVALGVFGALWFLSLLVGGIAELIRLIQRGARPVPPKSDFARPVLPKSDFARPVPQKNEFGSTIKTLRGEIVKSKSERIIADYLYHNNIDYNYEKPASSSGSGHRRISRPDFYLPTHNVYVEYWGLLDSADQNTRLRYETTMRWKMDQYSKNGIRVISLFPEDLSDLDKAFKVKLNQVTNAQA